MTDHFGWLLRPVLVETAFYTVGLAALARRVSKGEPVPIVEISHFFTPSRTLHDLVAKSFKLGLDLRLQPCSGGCHGTPLVSHSAFDVNHVSLRHCN
jgi:hypothetical protein